MAAPQRLGPRWWHRWVSLQLVVAVFLRQAATNGDEGKAVNATAPNPVTNADFTNELGRALKRPTFFPMPALVARILFGEMAQELLIQGQRVIPEKLLQSGFEFTHTSLESSLQSIYGRK